MSRKGTRRGVLATPVAPTAQAAEKVANSFAEYGVGFAPSAGLSSSQGFDAPNIDLEKTEEEASSGFGDPSQFGRLVGLKLSRGFDAENVDTEKAGEQVSISFGGMGLQFAEPISLAPYRSFDVANTDIYEWISEYIDQHLIVDESICSIYNTIARRCSFVLRQISSFGVYDDNKWETLCLKLSGLLAEMEAVAGEVCPHQVHDIQKFAKLIARQTPEFELGAGRGGARPKIISVIPPAPEPTKKRGRPANVETTVARGRPPNPDAVIARLSTTFLDSVLALSKLTFDDPEAIPIAQKIVRSHDRLRERGVDSNNYGHNDYLRAARRILNSKNAASRPRRRQKVGAPREAGPS